MIQTKIVNIREYLTKFPDQLTLALLLADSGDREPLVSACGGEAAAFSLAKTARLYGENCRTYGIQEYAIGISEKGKVIKMPYRLAGLLMVGIESFYALVSNRNEENSPELDLTKEQKVKMASFYKELISVPPTPSPSGSKKNM